MSIPAPSQPDPSGGTRERLVVAAERLFAERGIDSVSLREINLAAGQRNKSAVHYHFGGKPELVEAIFAHRMPVVDALRHERMDLLEAAHGDPDLHELVAAIVHPLAEQIDGHAGGSHYVRFLGQLEHDPHAWVLETFRGKYDHGARRALRVIAGVLSFVPQAIRAQRIADAVAFYVRALGDRERRVAQGTAASGELPLALFVSNLVDALAGMLSAPVSDATRVELEHDACSQPCAANEA